MKESDYDFHYKKIVEKVIGIMVIRTYGYVYFAIEEYVKENNLPRAFFNKIMFSFARDYSLNHIHKEEKLEELELV